MHRWWVNLCQILLLTQTHVRIILLESDQPPQWLCPQLFSKSEIEFLVPYGPSSGCKSNWRIHCWNLQRDLNTQPDSVCHARSPDQLRYGASAPDSKQTKQNLGPDFFRKSEIEFLVSPDPTKEAKKLKTHTQVPNSWHTDTNFRILVPKSINRAY